MLFSTLIPKNIYRADANKIYMEVTCNFLLEKKIHMIW